jgi:hypothetical protein
MTIVNNKNSNQFEFKEMTANNSKRMVYSYNGNHCLYCKKISDLYNLSFKHIIKSYDKKIKTNEDF